MPEFDESVVVDHKFAKKIYLAILFFTLVWVILIFLAPFFAGMGGIFESISSFIYIFFSKVCHQQDERSFHLLGYELGVCSRCLWIYTGFFIGTAVYPLKYRVNNITVPSLWILSAAAIILMIDVVLDSTGIWQNTFFSRSVTGFFIGFVLPFYVIPGFVKFFFEIHSFFKNKVSV